MAKYIVQLGKQLDLANPDRIYFQGETLDLSDEDIKKYGAVLELYDSSIHADLVKLAPKHEAPTKPSKQAPSPDELKVHIDHDSKALADRAKK